jgi:hypothetical protein
MSALAPLLDIERTSQSATLGSNISSSASERSPCLPGIGMARGGWQTRPAPLKENCARPVPDRRTLRMFFLGRPTVRWGPLVRGQGPYEGFPDRKRLTARKKSLSHELKHGELGFVLGLSPRRPWHQHIELAIAFTLLGCRHVLNKRGITTVRGRKWVQVAAVLARAS